MLNIQKHKKGFMIPLLKMYDDFTSDKYTSLRISTASTTFMAYKVISYAGDCGECIYSIYTVSPLVLSISLCAGVVFALLANKYFVQK